MPSVRAPQGRGGAPGGAPAAAGGASAGLPAGVASGVKLGAHVGGRPIDPSTGPFPPDEHLEHLLAEHIAQGFPGLIPEPLGPETCLYTMTPDEDFVLDRIGPLVIGAGFSGHGFKFGPLIGETLAALATGREPAFDLGRFRLDRPCEPLETGLPAPPLLGPVWPRLAPGRPLLRRRARGRRP